MLKHFSALLSSALLSSALFFLGLFSGCGGAEPASFEGTWSGAFTSLSNQCPFSVTQDINPLFPMQVSISGDNLFTVNAVDGSTAVGGQGDGETISFTASAPTFGNFSSTSTAGFNCTSSTALVGFLTTGDSSANVSLTYSFVGCTDASGSRQQDCAVTYFAEATR